MKVLLELLGDVSKLLSSIESLDDVRPEAQAKLKVLLETLHEDCGRLIETNDKPVSREAMFQRGLEAIASERLDEARSILEGAVKHFPEDPELHNHLGLVYWELGELEAAEQAYEKAVAVAFPHEWTDWYDESCRPFLRAMEGQALALYRMGRGEEAVDMFDGLASMNPAEYIGCRYLAGEIRHGMGDVKQALKDYQAVPREPAVTYNMALAHFELGDREQAAAVLISAFSANRFVAHQLLQRSDYPATTMPGYLASEAYAEEFLEACGHLWANAPGAVQFLGRCYGHPLVQSYLLDHARKVVDEVVGGTHPMDVEDALYADSNSVGHLVRQVLEFMDS